VGKCDDCKHIATSIDRSLKRLGTDYIDPNHNVPIVGAAKTTHLDVAVEALALKLDAEERAYLESPYRPRDEINDQNPVRRPRSLSAE
jgi:1-deoxyxylulose-5-phosphate synthase